LATAGYVVNNLQAADTTTGTNSAVTGTYQVTQTTANTITASTIEIANNSQSSSALTNFAANSMSLTGDRITTPTSAATGTTAALDSSQTGYGGVYATSTMTLATPADSGTSNLKLTGNTNSSLASINTATNTLFASATDLGSSATLGARGVATEDASTADFAVYNTQSALAGTLSSTATTTLGNSDTTTTTTVGVITGSVAITGDTTYAQSSANRSANSLTLTGTATQYASGALGNVQASSSTVAAVASTTGNFTMDGTSSASA
jgi:hypothetical protein